MARPRGNKWQADVLIPGKGRVRKTFDTRLEAEVYEVSTKQAATSDKLPTVGEVFPEYAYDLWAGSRDERNALRICDELVTYLGRDTPVRDVGTRSVENLAMVLRKKGNSSPTINTKLCRLSKLLKKAKRMELIESVPEVMLREGPRKRNRFLTDKEVSDLFGQMPEFYQDFCMFLLHTGCRLSEAVNLQWSDIDHKSVSFWQTKSGHPRTVPLSDTAIGVVQKFRGNNASGPFSAFSYITFRRVWARAKDAAGLGHDRDVVPHILRHTCASRLVQRSVPITVIQRFLGHSNIQMTMRYAHLSTDSLDIAAQALSV